MPFVPGLRSPYARVGRLVYFGRMLDKIRLHAKGLLPSAYVANYGEPRPLVFDARCCRFLGIAHSRIEARTLAGGADEEILAWVEGEVGRRSDEDCHHWNQFMTKIGWRDDRRSALEQRAGEAGLDPKQLDTFFDLLEADEGRDPYSHSPWLAEQKLRVLIVMGVAGSGKSTVGRLLANDLGWGFADADDFHPPANKAKMQAGKPLNDDDRAPWLAALRVHLDHEVQSGRSIVLACSALREGYRGVLATDLSYTRFIHLTGDPKLIQERLERRQGHFAGSQLLPSQLAALETPLEALKADLSLSPTQVTADIRRRLGL